MSFLTALGLICQDMTALQYNGSFRAESWTHLYFAINEIQILAVIECCRHCFLALCVTLSSRRSRSQKKHPLQQKATISKGNIALISRLLPTECTVRYILFDIHYIFVMKTSVNLDCNDCLRYITSDNQVHSYFFLCSTPWGCCVALCTYFPGTHTRVTPNYLVDENCD